MPIKFMQLFQDSWNFMRNQHQFSVFAIGAMLFIQLCQFVILQFFPMELSVNGGNPEGMLSVIIPTVVLLILTLLFTALIILNIKSVTNGSYKHFFQPVTKIVNSFFPLVILNIISAIPLAFTINAVASFAINGKSSISLVALPIVAMGFYLFAKLCLTTYVYLIEEPQKSVTETLSFTFRLSKGKMRPLILFCLLSSFLPLFIINSLERLGNGSFILILSAIISAFIGVFVIVFSFRFYQLYRQL
ncbi:hypothetical protein [Phocoenobacter skyensis]|uniref:Uncharacterized protein n=1 Tax=Phocoenobacter skyensis TaxID=97481 RepID=A0A1H7YA41_9PAST|nr:hypothetical protein [Pasteurella skyensis]MDP8078782.1 hypothetical protein [Pasteurella skyensis]MDP8085892.1 hypothetical protein [Pasteurella skyensis]MDP8170984.1 hypothetical protein [Pasteurella skyensis]MDP8175310.1 hypothetical protein [Pasteurella skyensis]MDP8185950.1 hypothetical protein [Pasteurella skyensis]